MSPEATKKRLHDPACTKTLSSRSGRVCALVALTAVLLPLAACAGFFVKPTTSTTTTTTSTTTSGDFAYVANSTAGTTYLSEYSIASSALNSLGSFSLGYLPVALAVAPSNNFLYVASVPGATNPGVYLYTIGSTGELTAGNGGNVLATDTVAAMAISPDGNWLYTVNVDGNTMTQYQVNTSTGGITAQGVVTLTGTACNLTAATPVSQSCSVAVSPGGSYVVASLGASGDVVYPYSSSGGISETNAQAIASGDSVATPTGDFSVALDENNYAYIARTSSLGVYQITSEAVTQEATLALPAGSVPRGVTLSRTYGSLYFANEGLGTIGAYGIGGNGALTAITGSPFAGPTNVAALAVDNTGAYLVAVGYDATAGVRLYSISSSGALAQVAESGSGTDSVYPALVAVTH